MRHFTIIILAFLAALLFNHYLCYRYYTLAENDNWSSTKTELKKGVVGAWSTMFFKSTLSGNKVDIASWHGYQEFIYKQPLAYRKIRFDVLPNGNAFSLLLHKSDSITYGVRLGNNEDYFFFMAQNSGAFLFKKPFRLAGSLFEKHKWNTIGFDINQGIVTLYVNEQKVDSVLMELPALIKPGMKGDIPFKSVFIDNIKAWDDKNTVILSEKYTPPYKLHFFSVFVFILLSLSGLFISRKLSLPYSLYIHAVVVICFAIYYTLYFYKFSSYFKWNDNYVNWDGVEPYHESAEDITTRLDKEYPIVSTHLLSNKILFIGTSQTWGAGASLHQKTMPMLIAQHLSADFPLDTFIILNTGISGSEAPVLWDLYKKKWSKYEPQLVLINLATNDYDTSAFRTAIRSFLKYNNHQGITTLLIEEPNDVVTPRLVYNHQIMRDEAKKYGVKCLSLQQQIDSASTGGFLWWDYVHFTDYGYKVLADLIYPSIDTFIVHQKSER